MRNIYYFRRKQVVHLFLDLIFNIYIRPGVLDETVMYISTNTTACIICNHSFYIRLTTRVFEMLIEFLLLLTSHCNLPAIQNIQSLIGSKKLYLSRNSVKTEKSSSGSFSVSHLLGHGISVDNVYFIWPWHSYILPSVWQGRCHYLF